MKKRFSILFAIILIVTCIISLVACNKNGQTVSSKDLGTYYKVDGTDLDPDSFIELKSGNKWYDGEFEGKFTIKDGKITLYDGDDELMSGTVSDGVLTLNFMGMETVYKKGTPSSKVDPTPTPTPTPTPSNEFTVTFYLNDGTKNSETKQTENELITYTPIRSGYIFNGWWISSGNTETDEPILTKRWDMSQKVDNNDLVLYAEWVVAPTEDAQLPAPSVSVEGYRYFWDSIKNAESYNVILKKGYDVIEEKKTYDTYWDFSQSYASGTYTLSVRANGDGIKSINSSYTVKYISHRVLGKLSFCNFDKSTATLSWGSVEGATSYDVFVDGMCILEDTNEKSYVLTDVNAGTHTVVINGKKDNWQTSFNSFSIYKDMLKTPSDFRAYFDYDNMEYVLEWDEVRGVANSEIVYKIYNGTKLVKQIEDNFYKISKSDWYSSEKTKRISVIAFDKMAETIQSIPTDKLEIKRMLTIEANSNLEDAGTFNVDLNVSDIKVTFDYNYKDCPAVTEQVLNKNNPSIEYFTPERNGYAFLGWFKDKHGTKRFDFSSTLKSDITLYARWQEIDEQASILDLNEDVKIYANRDVRKFVFVPMKAGKYRLYFKNENSGQMTNISVAQGVNTIYSPLYQTSTWWVDKEIELSAYQVVTIAISATSDNSSGYFTFKMEGDALPTCNPDNFKIVKIDNKMIVPADSEMSFSAEPNRGYNCLGWFENNDKQLSDQSDYRAIASFSSSSYTVKWAINEELKGCVFTSTADTCIITGITDKTITEFVIPDYVTGIGDEAFKDCTKLSSITIGKNVTSIGNSAFSGCPIENATMPTDAISSIPKENLAKAVINGGENIEDNAFKGCTRLTSVTIPNSVTSIGDRAFYGCTGLTFITIPNSVTSIGQSAFAGCTGLTSITIPNSVTSIENWAFEDCYNLIEVCNKSSLNIVAGKNSYGYVGYYAKNVYTQEGGSKLSTDENGYMIYTDESKNEMILVKYTGNDVELTLPNGITSIHNYTFYYCTGLTSITIPDSVTSIGRSAFEGTAYYNNESNWKNGVLYIGKHLIKAKTNINGAYEVKPGTICIAENAFYGCTGLTSVTIPDGVKSIGYEAFRGCKGLNSIIIPDSVTSIGNYAFRGCNLETIEVSLGNGVYYSEGNCIIEKATNKLIVGCKNSVIPNSVTNVGEYAFQDCTGLTFITIPNSVTSIGWGAFSGCSNLATVNWNATSCASAGSIFSGCSKLTTINIGNNVTRIPDAFRGCTGLNSITIPDSVTSIGDRAFEGCTGLTSVTIGNNVASIGDRAFEGCTELTSITIPNNVASIGERAFYGNTGLTSITIPDSVTSIGERAFYGCTGLTSITIPDSVTSIGYSAFYGCTGLISITIPNSVTSIGSYAFYGCTGLISITIPNSVTSIGDRAFEGCTELTSITIPNNVASIGERAFYGSTGLTSVTMGNSVTSIGSYAFKDCNKLKINCEAASQPSGWNKNWNPDNRPVVWGYNNITTYSEYDYVVHSDKVYLTKYKGTSTIINIPNQIDGKDVVGFGEIFKGNTNIREVTIGNSVTSIGDSVFKGCTGLTSVTIGNGVTSIKDYAFYGCTGLTSVTMGNSVTSIGSYAFLGCIGLTSVTMPESVTNIGYRAFYNTAYYNNESNWENGVLYIGKHLIEAKNTVSGDYEVKQGTICIADYAFSGCKGLNSITISDSVTSIGWGAFYGCTGLTSVTMGNSVTSIGSYAFLGCIGLTSITIPNSVTSIGNYVFYGCDLETIEVSLGNGVYYSEGNCIIEKATNKLIVGCKNSVIPNSVTNVGEYAFQDCTGLTFITIPNSVTSIGWGAFDYCKGLISITIPNSVTSIGDYAFSGCTELTSINFNGTKAQWSAIKKGYNWKYNVPSTCNVVCTDGTISIND